MANDIDTGKIHSEKVSTMNRRRLMQTLASMGFGATTAATLAVKDVEAAGTGEVPITFAIRSTKSGNYEPDVRYVPSDWYDDLQVAERQFQKTSFMEIPGVIGQTLIPGQIGGHNAKIRVEINEKAAVYNDTTLDHVRDKIPDHMGEVPVELEEVGLPTKKLCYDHDYDDPPTGAICGPNYDSWGTLGPPMFKNNNSYYTCNYHVFDNYGTMSGGDFNQHNQHIGNIVDWRCHQDWVAAEPTNGFTPSRDIAGTSKQTSGHLTKDGINTIASKNESVYKRGVKTCWSGGEVIGIGDATVWDEPNCARRSHQVKWGSQSDMGDGDSGSTAFHPDDRNTDVAYVACINAARTGSLEPGDFVFGTGAYRIHQTDGYWF